VCSVSRALSDQLLLNFVLLGLVEVPGAALAGVACERIGARRATIAFLSAASATLLALAAVQHSADAAAQSGQAAVALALVGKSLSAGVFTTVFLSTSEIYPTELRAGAIGCGMCFGKVGAALAPTLSAALSLPVSLGLTGVSLACAAAAATTLPQEEEPAADTHLLL
jgi:MFS family permease